MSLSAFLQSPEIIQSISGRNPEEVRDVIMEKGMSWFEEHPGERHVIQKNLDTLGQSYDASVLTAIQEHIVLHYCEKVLPLCGPPEYSHTFLMNRINAQNALSLVHKHREAGEGILIALAHFGGVELITPTFSMHAFPVNVALRFTTAQFSQAIHAQARAMTASGLFGPISFIEIGKPGTTAALDMAAVLRRGEVLFAVFDEKTQYSKPVSLFSRKVYGGAGLDRLLQFAHATIAVFNAFMVRREDFTYDLQLIPIDPADPDFVQTMYHNLERMVIDNREQWYFLHEEIPFIEEEL